MDLHLKKCPLCGGELVTKKVHEVVRGNGHTATVLVTADICLHCGERLYSMDTFKQLDEIRVKLIKGDTADFKPVGQSFQVV